MSAADGFIIGRFGRLLALIAFVSAVFLLTASWRLPSELFSIAAVVIGTIAMVTAITGFLIASVSYMSE